MKTVVIILVFGFLALGSCTQRMDTKTLLDNPETRSEIFKAIANDHDCMMSFMESIEGNGHAIEMMQGNHMMMGNMMKGRGMHMMMNDSLMMHSMMEHMMKNKKVMGNMMQMMNHEGMMSNDCMHAMMQSMNEKGM